VNHMWSALGLGVIGCTHQSFICNDSDASLCWSYDAEVSNARMTAECVSGVVGEAGVEGEDIECSTEDAVGTCAVGDEEPKTFTYYASGGQPFDVQTAEAACDELGGTFTPT
jgi:hypothetical protein